MSLSRMLCLPVALLPLAAICGGDVAGKSRAYAEAIKIAFPGFQILAPAEVGLVKEEMSPRSYAERKGSPALVEGRFNADSRVDFAAVIRSREMKSFKDEPLADQQAYESFLVFCLGRMNGKYDCRKVEDKPTRIHLPHDRYLAKKRPGKAHCLTLSRFAPPRKTYDQVDEVTATGEEFKELVFAVDAFAYMRTMGNGDILFVLLGNDTMAECLISD